MHVHSLIIGQGICGTLLSYFLQQAGLTCCVIDDERPNSASRVAAGAINPITGRIFAQTWLANELLPFAEATYTQLQQQLGMSLIAKHNILHLFPSAQMQESFNARLDSGNAYLQRVDDASAFSGQFHFFYGAGLIRPAYAVYLHHLLYAWRGQLISQQVLRAETFERAQLIVSGDGVRYQDIKAEYIIFADGAAAFDNPWFGLLPFSLNKGEALVVRIPQLLPDYIYKKGLTLVPLMNERGAHEALYWVGSSYQNQFADALPSAAFRESTVAQLRQWLRMDFTVEDHKAGVRPATVERRPFVGLHPQHLRVGILNGMGTKGCSLAPYFAWQLVQHLQTGAAIVPEADVQRFRRVLGKV